MQFPKDKTYRSEEYKAYIRTLPCIVCGGNAEPHHEVGGKPKGSDLFCIPLCRQHHWAYGSLGQETFWREHNMDRWKTVAETIAGYVEYKEGE